MGNAIRTVAEGALWFFFGAGIGVAMLALMSAIAAMASL